MKMSAKSCDQTSALPDTLSILKLATMLCCWIVCLTLPLMPQNTMRVKGRVGNRDGTPLANTSVTIKGSTVGASTETSGNFQVDAPSKRTLVISFVDHERREVVVVG